jgi:hypothetical protein
MLKPFSLLKHFSTIINKASQDDFSWTMRRNRISKVELREGW